VSPSNSASKNELQVSQTMTSTCGQQGDDERFEDGLTTEKIKCTSVSASGKWSREEKSCAGKQRLLNFVVFDILTDPDPEGDGPHQPKLLSFKPFLKNFPREHAPGFPIAVLPPSAVACLYDSDLLAYFFHQQVPDPPVSQTVEIKVKQEKL